MHRRHGGRPRAGIVGCHGFGLPIGGSLAIGRMRDRGTPPPTDVGAPARVKDRRHMVSEPKSKAPDLGETWSHRRRHWRGCQVRGFRIGPAGRFARLNIVMFGTRGTTLRLDPSLLRPSRCHVPKCPRSGLCAAQGRHPDRPKAHRELCGVSRGRNKLGGADEGAPPAPDRARSRRTPTAAGGAPA